MEKNIAERIKVVVFDADDTLWANQPYFDEAEDRYSSLLSDYGEAEYIKGELFSTEMRNMDELGFGATAFTLSMIETALRIGGESLPVSAVSDIYAVGRSLLRIPATPLEGVEETLQRLAGSRRFRLVVLTKGNLLDQERKLERSGLGRYFDHVEIVSDKNEKAYSDFVAFLGIDASEMIMVGNSFKSDIAPVLAIGGYGAYIPFHTTWQHETGDDAGKFRKGVYNIVGSYGSESLAAVVAVADSAYAAGGTLTHLQVEGRVSDDYGLGRVEMQGPEYPQHHFRRGLGRASAACREYQFEELPEIERIEQPSERVGAARGGDCHTQAASPEALQGLVDSGKHRDVRGCDLVE